MTPEERAESLIEVIEGEQVVPCLREIAAAIRAAEADMRERCAKVCEDLHPKMPQDPWLINECLHAVATQHATAIRALR